MGVKCEVRGIEMHRTRGREMLQTLAVGWRVSTVRGKEAGRFRKEVGVSICRCRQSAVSFTVNVFTFYCYVHHRFSCLMKVSIVN